MGRRLVTLAARVALLVVALALAVDVAYFVHGSLEMHPTEERQAAVRFATGLAAFFLTLKRRLNASSPTNDAASQKLLPP